MKLIAGKLLILALAGFTVLVSVRCGPLPRPAEPPPDEADDADAWPIDVRLRYLAKDRVIRELLAGRRSLLQAAALFATLNVTTDGDFRFDGFTPDDFAQVSLIPGRTPAERVCRQVQAWACAAVQDDKAQEQAVAQRLLAQYREAIARDGEVRLPDPATVESAAEILASTRASLTDKERRDLYGNRPN